MKYNIIVTIIAAALLIFILLQNGCANNEDVEVPIETEVTIPEKIGSFDPIIPTPLVIRDTVKETDTIILEDKEKIVYKDTSYNNTDLPRNTYLETFDNDDVSFKIKANTRGYLTSLSIPEYTIKEQTFTHRDTVTIKNPYNKVRFSAGPELGIPTTPDTHFLIKGSIFVEKDMKKYSLGIDNQRRVWTGFYLVF